VEQGVAVRAAGGFNPAVCGTSTGDLDPGMCTDGFTVIASHITAGTGTLVAGAAMARLVMPDDGSPIDQFIVNVALV